VERALTQEEIDATFEKVSGRGARSSEPSVQDYDFRRVDRIGKDQLRLIRLLHENFARNLAASLSAYLRAYVAANVVSIEQLSFAEFYLSFNSPTCLVTLGVQPSGGTALLEMNPTVAFPIVEMLLGGTGKPSKADRALTELEQSLLDNIYMIMLRELETAWKPIAPITLTLERRITEPQLLQVSSPDDTIVAVTIDLRVGGNIGLMNLGMHSTTLRQLRKAFTLHYDRKAEARPEEQAARLRQVAACKLRVEATLEGPTIPMVDVLALAPGDVLSFDYPVDRPVQLNVNGKCKFRGRIVAANNHRTLAIG